MIVSELLAKFGLQTDKASFAKADASLQGLVGKAKQFVGFFGGLFAVQQLSQFIEGLIQTGSELNDTSIKLGIATDALQQYRFAAQQTGATQADLETGFRFLSRSAFDAASGGKEAAKVYKRLGVEVKGADGNVRGTEDLFSDTAEALSKVTNETEKTALALKIFGRGGTALLPMLSEGAAGLEKMRQEARELGGGFDENFIKRADELGDNLDKLKFMGLGLKNALGNALFPILDRGVTKLIDWGKGLNQVMRGSKILEIALMSLAAVSVIAGIRALIPWLPFIATFAAIAAAVLFAMGLIDDIHAMLSGGKSLIGKYLDEWLGIGTTDRLVRQWATGIEILSNQIMGLVSIAFEAGGVLKDFFSGDWAAWSKSSAKFRERVKAGILEAAGDFDSGMAAFKKTITGKDTDLAARTQGRGMDSPLALDPHTPRTQGRGIGAPLQEGSAGFGQAGIDAIQSLMSPGEASSPAPGGGAEVNQSVSVTVNAKTGADPEEIGNIAARKVSEKLGEQNRNLKAALVNRHAQ